MSHLEARLRMKGNRTLVATALSTQPYASKAGNHSIVEYMRVLSGNEVYRLVRKIHPDSDSQPGAVTAQLEAKVMQELHEHGSPVPLPLDLQGNAILMEDIRYADTQKIPILVRVPLIEVLRAVHLKSEEGDSNTAIAMLTKARAAYQTRVADRITPALKRVRIETPDGVMTGFEYIKMREHAKLASAFTGISEEDLRQFPSYYEVLRVHLKHPYFNASPAQLTAVLEPVKVFDIAIPGQEIAFNTSPTNIFVGIPSDFIAGKFHGQEEGHDMLDGYSRIFHAPKLMSDKIIDFSFIDFSSYRLGCEEQDMCWLFMHPEALDPREGHRFNAKSSLDKLIKAHAQEKAYRRNSFSSIFTQRMYLSALREGIRDIALFTGWGNRAAARYYHELVILASENLPDALGMSKLTDFLKQQYHAKYDEPFNHEVPFTIALKADYDPYGSFVKRRLPGISYRRNPNIPAVPAEQLLGLPCKEKGIIQRIYETTR